jgi:hypothetical protein
MVRKCHSEYHKKWPLKRVASLERSLIRGDFISWKATPSAEKE